MYYLIEKKNGIVKVLYHGHFARALKLMDKMEQETFMVNQKTYNRLMMTGMKAGARLH